MTAHAHFCTFTKDGSLVRGCRACERNARDPRGLTESQLTTIWDWYEAKALLSDLDAMVVRHLERARTLMQRLGWMDYPWTKNGDKTDDDKHNARRSEGERLDASTQRSVDQLSSVLRS